jgi:hypothetical protein
MDDQAKGIGKVEIRIGNLSFSAEGEQDWLSAQLIKVLEAASPTITQAEKLQPPTGGESEGASETGDFTASLASFLKAKGGDNKQIQRFLATAAWLFRRGNKTLTSSVVATALSENHQKRLANPADYLNKNCSKGYCEKTKEGFFITPDGWASLGEKP